MQALISSDTAETIIRQHLPSSPVEKVPLAEAQGRYLRQDILADRPIPPFDRVMMDGIAIQFSAYAAGRTSFPVAATQAAGAPATQLPSPESCIEVMTGCMLPSGCDCIIPVERIEIVDSSAQLKPDAKPKRNQHIHRTGSDTPAGAILLESGSQLHAPELTIAASCGATSLLVSKLPSILVITTGDEVVAPDQTPLPHQIRRSHATALHSAISSFKIGSVNSQHIDDSPEATYDAIDSALQKHDILVLTGGVSMGKYDYVAPALERLLGAPLFHGVAQKPGKPFAFWQKEGSAPVFALPGNPVSVMACAARYLFPSLKKVLTGKWPTPQSLNTQGTFHCSPHFNGLIPSVLHNGSLSLQPPSNSGNYLSLARTQGVAELAGKLAGQSLLNQAANFYPWA